MFFSAAMAVDVGHVIVAHREVYLATESASLAGAWQAQGGQLNSMEAWRVASDTLTREQQPVGPFNQSSLPGVHVDFAFVSASGNVVDVIVQYHINNIVFAGFFDLFANQTYTVEASSFVCSSQPFSAVTNSTHGECVRPI